MADIRDVRLFKQNFVDKVFRKTYWVFIVAIERGAEVVVVPCMSKFMWECL